MSNFSTLNVCAWPTRGAARLAAKKKATAISKCLVIRHLRGGANSTQNPDRKVVLRTATIRNFRFRTLTVASYASHALEATISPPEVAPLTSQNYMPPFVLNI